MNFFKIKELSSPLVVTFGCRLNFFESERIKELLALHSIYDVIVVNTCAVTAEAERQARQKIRKLFKEYPNKKIVVTGCSATINKNFYDSMDEVFAVLSNENKFNTSLLIPKLSENGSKYTEDDLPVLNSYTNFIINKGFENRSRAFVQIQNGCDNFCSFCVTRLARGSSVSFPVKDIIRQVKQFEKLGFSELTLTGIDIASYNYEGIRLGKLLLNILENIDPKTRVRLSSLDPNALDNEFLEALKNTNIMPHIHLSIQSGDDEILKKMLRRHNHASVATIIKKMKKIRNNMVIGADFIVGFPTETEANFRNTCTLIQENEIALAHVFPYSDRPGTAAALLRPKIAKKIKKDRVNKLNCIASEMFEKVQDSFIGENINLLVEKQYTKEEYFGKTDNFLPIVIKSDQKVELGSVVTAIVTGRILKGKSSKLIGIL